MYYQLCFLLLQTWTDSAALAALFEESKARSIIEPSCAKPRAPGLEVSSVQVAAVTSSSPRSHAKGGGKLKWVCGCCKNTVSKLLCSRKLCDTRHKVQYFVFLRMCL